MIGGLQKVVHKRLYRDEPDVAARAGAADLRLVALLPPSPGPARRRRRNAAPNGRRPSRSARRIDSPPDRVLRALAATVAEKGYPGATVAEIVDRASTSQRTFYENFANKEEALLAALDTRLGADARQHPAGLPPRPGLAARGAHRLRGDVLLRPRRARVQPARRGRDVRGGQTGAGDPRHDHGRASRRCSRRATSSPPRPRRSPPRRSAARSTRSSTTRSRRRGPRACRSWSRWRPT